MLQGALVIVSLLALAAPVVTGGKADRGAALVLFAGMLASPLVQNLMIGDLRWGVALVDTAVAVALTVLALRAERWWLIGAAGLQGAVVLTHVAALGPDFLYNWTAVTVRLVTWCALLAVLTGGAWEAHLSRRHGLAAR